MKHMFLFGFLFSIFLVTGASAQIAEFSATEILKHQIRQGNIIAILQAADAGGKELTPFLKQLAANIENRHNKNSPAFYAQAALAKLGDPQALDEILLDIESSDPNIQDSAINKLGYVKNRRAYQKLYELLDDSNPRANPKCQEAPEAAVSVQCDTLFFPRNVVVIWTLLAVTNNVPTTSRKPTPETIQLWKTWLESNDLLK